MKQRLLKIFILAMWFAASAGSSLHAGTTTIDPTTKYQTIEGFGGATAFYGGWIPAHPYKLEIYTNAFAGLKLSMLRLGDWFRYNTNFNNYSQGGDGPVAGDIVSNANRILGHPVPVYMSSWSPPAFLKSNGQVGNGGTLILTNGSFAYTNFAQYWYDSLSAYQSNGVSPSWISIQNEPDFIASYDSCVLEPTEETVNGTNYASYAKALTATYQLLTNLPSPPKLLAPECVHIAFNDLQNYSGFMQSGSFYGIATHLYGDSSSGAADGNIPNLGSAANIFSSKPHFMTEYGYPDLMNTACLIHDCLTTGQDVGFNYWSLIWPVGGNALVQIENPYNLSSWTNAPAGVTTDSHGWWLTPAYWAMKHYSYFIQPGYQRVSATGNDNNVRSSAYLSPDGLTLVVVLINTNTTASSAMSFNFGSFNAGLSSVYQTAGTNTYAGTNTFLSLGALANPQTLPPLSLTTIVLNQVVAVGAASNSVPATGASGIALNSSLTWMPGNNALMHAVYFGINSNAVAQATTTSQEFQGTVSTTNFTPVLAAGLTYFWRVDEIAGANTNTGTVWTFSTVAPSANFQLNASDALNSSSFNAIGNWVTNGTTRAASSPPNSASTYNTSVFTLRTPTSGNAAFGGASLTLSSGAPTTSGSLLLKGPNGAAVTINNLIMSGGVLAQGVNSGIGGIEWVGGYMNVLSNSFVSGLGTTARYIGISSEISGGASLSNDCNVIYSGNNSGFTGQLIVGSGGVVQAGGSINLGGPGASLVLNNGTFQPSASLAMNNAGNVMINSGGGVLQIASGLTLNISNPITGPGNLLCDGGGLLQIAGANSATGNLVVSNATLALLGNATFQNAQLGVSNNAILDVTALAVPLVIGKQITLAGNVAGVINKTNVTSMLVASNITYGGTLTLSNTGPALVYGDTIKLFSASNYYGAFNQIIPAIPGPSLLWNTNWISVNGTLFVTSTNPALMTPPRITGVSQSGAYLMFAGTNGNAPGTYYYVLSSTNLAPIPNWMLVKSNQFGPGGGFSGTNNFDPASPQQFFMLRLP